METLQEQLERSIGDGPPLPPVEARVAAGRRALRRRRAATGVASLAAAAVVVAGWFAVAPGNDDDTVRPADRPTSGVSEEPTTSTAERPWQRGELIRYVDGTLQVRPGVRVIEHLENPYNFEPPSLSDALDVTWKGKRQWLIIESRPKPYGISSSASTPSNGWASFRDYVADQVDADGGDSGWPPTFELDAEGRVVPTPGTTVVNRTDDPRLGPEFAPPGATTGAAVISVAGDPGNYFVVWRVIDGSLDIITTPPDDIVGATFEELLTGARTAYSSGEGLR